MTARVKSKAARDFACNEDDTRIVDATEDVYRVTGCGMVASYQCSEKGTSLSMRCEQLYVNKAPDEESTPKGEPGSSLAKSN